MDETPGNAVIGQAGGPTPVINQSLVGVIEGLRKGSAVKRILGARHGVRGMVNEQFVDLTDYSPDQCERIACTPAACLGSTRDKPNEEYCERIFEKLRKHDIRYFFYIGGNDSADTCRIVNDLSNQAGYELRCFHVPKTIDNDLMESDHTPGYPSAARFVAMAMLGDNLDNASLPGVKINVVMGRHAGFLTAAASLARQGEDDGPHLIYVPETNFDPDRFVADVDRVYSRLGRCHIAVSEGIHNAEGQPITAMMSAIQETDQFGNVQLSGTGALGDWLAHLVRTKLTPEGGKPPRVRADTFGYIQRAWPEGSPIDRREARDVGVKAAEIALAGDHDGSVAIKRDSDEPYRARCEVVPLNNVAGKTRTMPHEYLAGDNDIAESFRRYALPLVGDLPTIARVQ